MDLSYCMRNDIVRFLSQDMDWPVITKIINFKYCAHFSEEEIEFLFTDKPREKHPSSETD